jgi:hypothetical protein
MGNFRKMVHLPLYLLVIALLVFAWMKFFQPQSSPMHEQSGLFQTPVAGISTTPMATAVPPLIFAQQGPKPTATSKTKPNQAFPPPVLSPGQNTGHPVMAFYYTWYTTSTWCSCQMSDLPTVKYQSSDNTTIERQLNWAAAAGLTGFISSWWGAGDQTDTNFKKLLGDAAGLASSKHYDFNSSIYFETDAPALQGSNNTVNALNYLANHYMNDPHFFHWQGHPVIFFWDPLGNGRTLSYWANIRQQVDPNHQMIWSAEGVDMNLLTVFDGIHLFSGGYWGLQSGTMPAVDLGFRNKVTAYNQANGTQKIWAAGVIPGYDDTRVPGRTGTYIVPRNNGATYTTGWQAAMSSNPEWITITSFNEWFEGAEIEPSVTYGNEYLDLTQQFTSQWHG